MNELRRKVWALLDSNLPREVLVEVLLDVFQRALKRAGGRPSRLDDDAPQTSLKSEVSPTSGQTPNSGVLLLGSDPVSPSDPEPSQPILEKVKRDEPLPAGFAEFWSLYPRRVAKSDALRAWKKKRPPMAKVREALAWQRKDPWWVDGNAPYPASWINSGRWDDEPVDFAARIAQQRRTAFGASAPPEPHCRYHARGQHQRQQAPKHEWSPTCPECKHMGAWTKPRTAGEPTAVGDLLAGMNGGKS